jgi:hypothetical protein
MANEITDEVETALNQFWVIAKGLGVQAGQYQSEGRLENSLQNLRSVLDARRIGLATGAGLVLARQ